MTTATLPIHLAGALHTYAGHPHGAHGGGLAGTLLHSVTWSMGSHLVGGLFRSAPHLMMAIAAVALVVAAVVYFRKRSRV